MDGEEKKEVVKMVKKRKGGWHGESRRHSLAGRGIKTGRKSAHKQSIKKPKLSKVTKVKKYHCPNCDAYQSMYPAWKGRGRYYRCEKCDKTYSKKQLDKIWDLGDEPELTVLNR